MSIESFEYAVHIEDFAERHYIKVFSKKYKKAWVITKNAIVEMFVRFDSLYGLTDKVDVLMLNCDKLIIKLDFKVAGTKESAKSSGKRVVAYIDKELFVCRILLVYSKNQIGPPNETQKCKQIIKTNYPEIWNYF